MTFPRKSTGSRLLLFGVRAAVCLVVLMVLGLTANSQPGMHNEERRIRRSALNVTDAKNKTNTTTTLPYCVPPSIEEFPPDFLTSRQRRDGGVIIHVIITLYLLAVLTIVCDDYFVPSLQKICDRLGIGSDVGGATFMAAGCSAPELFASIIGVFIAKSDVGLGTIVGSAVFNILFVIGVCALVSKTVIELNWYPFTRDCIYYMVSVLAIVLVILDRKVEWYEGMILLMMYAVYIVVMYFNERIQSWANRLVLTRGWTTVEERHPFSRLDEKPQSESVPNPENAEIKTVEETAIDGTPPPVSDTGVAKATDTPVKEDDEENESIFDIPKTIPKKILWILMMPASLLMFITIPDCRRPFFRKCYVLTFIICLVWIAATAYIIVWMVCVIGYTAGVPDSVMGLTFIAAGASLPEIISCIIVTRAGKGNMALSGSIGSNVFDLLLCLGLPWFISSAIIHPGVPVTINSAGLTYSSVMLFSTVILLLVGTKLNKWMLDVKYGIVLLILWIIITVLMCLFELNVFGNFRPATCAFD